MKRYINKIKINNLFHLKNIEIEIADENAPHLILTGKNGSGKTVLLNAIADYFDKIKSDTNFDFLDWEKRLAFRTTQSLKLTNDIERAKNQEHLDFCKQQLNDLKGRIDISLDNVVNLIQRYNRGNFIIAFYQAARKTAILEPKNPTKPTLRGKRSVKDVVTDQILNFLSDLKIQEALARNENQITDADYIKAWLNNFENILRQIFDDKNLKLEFNYRDYTFHILTNSKSFKFTQLSDGFVAVIEIVADLILKMQSDGSISSHFNKPGIVLIDEIETHLHLKLQKSILPMLTALFPNIQFIVTTHSPFVLSSLPNATAYDLEHREPITNLPEFSYQALTEGYFGVSTDSDYARMRYKELEQLLVQDELSETERQTARQIIVDFKKIPEATSPELVGAYRQLEIKYNEKIKGLIWEMIRI